MRRASDRLLRYGTAVSATGVAAFASAGFYPILAGTPSVLFIAAVTVAAWYGGVGPGLLATGIGALTFDFLFIDSPYSFTIESPLSAIYLLAFICVELLITYLTASLRRDV